MCVKEKLVELLDIIIQPGQKTLGDIADYLISHGVTVQECKLGAKKSNADRIRSMSDEELAEFIVNIKARATFCKTIGNNEAFEKLCSGEWLQQPMEVSE